MKHKTVGVIVSGGDAPGVNAILAGLMQGSEQLRFLGFHGGYDGIAAGAPVLMDGSTAAHHITEGRSLLQTSRSKLPRTEEGRAQILSALDRHGVDALVVCGGDGSMRAAQLLEGAGLPCVGVPLTIDNNLWGVQATVGYSTAVGHLVSLLHSLEHTAHNMPGRAFLVEAFGAETGHLVLAGALAGGADIAYLPEGNRDSAALSDRVEALFAQGRESVKIVCGEGSIEGGEYVDGEQGAAVSATRKIQARSGRRLRYTVMGYYQRGGDPSPEDNLLGQQLGAQAALTLEQGVSGVLMGTEGGVPFAQLSSRPRPLDPALLALAKRKGMLL